jgi:hypothetical protein
MKREVPLYTLEGVKDAEATTHWFATADGQSDVFVTLASTLTGC